MKLYTNTNRILSTLMASTMTLSLLATTTTATTTPTTQTTQSTTISTPYAVTKENSYAYLMRLLELLGNESQTPEEVAAALTEVQQALRECTYNGEVLTRANADVLQSMVYNAPTISDIDKEELNALIESLVEPMGTTSSAQDKVAQLSNTSTLVAPLNLSTEKSTTPSQTSLSARIMTLSETVDEPAAAPVYTDSDTFPTWAVPYITDATTLGLVGGYEDNSFKANQNMKVCEFLVMVTNSYKELGILSEDSVAEYYVNGEKTWYGKYVYVADKSGLLPVGMSPTETDMTKDITREEAAYIVYKAMTTLGNESNGNKTLPTGNIKDYSSISDGKRESVTQLYMFGIMSGTDVDTQGFSTFSPQKPLTRSELCVIMLALNEPERRSPASTDPIADYSGVQYGPNGEQIIQAGVSYERPMAQEGDVVIDANGNEVPLVKDPETGVLGWGQHVAADLGLISPNGKEVVDDRNLYWPGATDSLGNSVTSQSYHVNQLTGEGHWACEIIAMNHTKPNYEAPMYTLSDDMNWLSGGGGSWLNCFTNDVTWERIEEMKANS